MAAIKVILTLVYLIAALAIIGIVLIQEGKSAGLGSITGSSGGGDSYWSKIKGRSLEGKLDQWTRITAILFILLGIVLMLIN